MFQDITTEIEIIPKRVGDMAVNLDLKAALPAEEAVAKVVTIFRELRRSWR